MSKKSGVSMLVLSVTIVVMAILAATAISFLEDSDIIPKAKDTTNDTNLQQIQELMRVVWNNANATASPTLEELQEAVDNAVAANNIDTTKYNIIVTEDEIYVSRDFVAPIISSTSMTYTNTTATVDLSFIKVEDTDYPVTIEYYIKKATLSDEAYSYKEKLTLTSGKQTSYTYTGLTSATTYNAKIVITDANGNSAETVLNLTTQ